MEKTRASPIKGAKKGNFKKNHDSIGNQNSSSKIVTLESSIIYGSILVTSVVTGIVFKEVWIIPFLAISLGIAFILVKIGINVGRNPIARLFGEISNGIFTLKGYMQTKDDNNNRDNFRFIQYKN